MKRKPLLKVKIATGGYLLTEVVEGLKFEYPDVPGTWSILEGTNRYVLCSDLGRQLIFLEFYYNDDVTQMYKRREWVRRPRDDNFYTLSGKSKYHGMGMSTTFGQSIRDALRKGLQIESSHP